jgi:hypothetical protein
VTVGIDRLGQAVSPKDLREQSQISPRALRLLKESSENLPCGIELATVALLHSSEPKGEDILSYVTNQSQKAVKLAKDAVHSAKNTTQRSSATVTAAQDVATTTTDDANQKAQVQQAAKAAQSDLANTEQTLSVIDAVLSDAANCKKLNQ